MAEPRITLEYGEPPPLFLNAFPLSDGIVAICVINFLVNAFVVACASSVVPVTIWAWQVSPLVQTLLSAWSVVGISLIVGALVGVWTYSELPMRPYCYWLSLSTLGLFAVLC